MTVWDTFRRALRRNGPDNTVRVVPVAMEPRLAGTPLANNPIVQEHYVGREPLGVVGLTIPRQDTGIGAVIPQAGANRPIVPIQLGLPGWQSVTRMPDGRIIARAMPRAGVDSAAVIRP